jgi:membrane protease YdiL (CAAX protease family)
VSWRAVWLSSAVFALEHRELAAGLLAGLAYAWLYRRHGDLRLAVFAHALTNAALAAYVVGDTHFEYW